jgi:hypothetical protein
MTVDTFLELLEDAEGLELARLEPLTTLFVQTRNSIYRLVVKEGRDVLLQGGSFFPEPTPAHVEGARASGSLLKTGWIVIGLLMEFRVDGKVFATSPVMAIAAEPPGETPVN